VVDGDEMAVGQTERMAVDIVMDCEIVVAFAPLDADDFD
jgi:hypothetical protein